MEEYVRNKLFEVRAEKGITQEELAESIKVSRQTVISIERGRYTPSVLLALKIARYFKKSVEEIFSIQYEK